LADRSGYRAYRGKRAGGKALLAGVLVLVILAAVAVLLVQQYIVYDKTGAPRLEVPWKESGEPVEEEPVEVDLVIRQPEAPETLRGRLLPVLTLTECQAALAEEGNTVAVTLKDGTGTVFCPLPSVIRDAVVPPEDGALQALLESGRHTVARLSCFRDPVAAAAYADAMGLMNTGGFLFYDGANTPWLDPAKSAAREYLCAIARETAELGFREILLADVAYPTEGDPTRIACGEAERGEHLQTFLREMRTALEPYGVKLSVELPAEVILSGEDVASGQILAEIAPLVDCIYAQILPEQAEACAAAVSAAAETAAFVPVLNGTDPLPAGDCLLQ